MSKKDSKHQSDSKSIKKKRKTNTFQKSKQKICSKKSGIKNQYDKSQKTAALKKT
jgi:DNA-directed RNA polymerase beta subunit